MITSASLLYKRPAGTVGCLNLSKVSKVTDRELPIIIAWLKDMTDKAEIDDKQVVNFLNGARDNESLVINSNYYLVKLDKWVYVQGVNRDPYIQVAQNK